MKKIIFIALSVFLAQNIYAEQKASHYDQGYLFGDCSFTKIEKDSDGLLVFLKCGKLGEQKCYVQKDVKGYKDVENGNVWKSLDNKSIVVDRSLNTGLQNITKMDTNGKFEGILIGDCISFFTRGKAKFDVATGEIKTPIKDEINFPFVDDPQLIGTWRSVDFVETTDKFEPGKKQFKDHLWLQEVKFSKKGKTNMPACTWTKGMILNTVEPTASKYEMKNIGGKNYMFLEWKSGDYIWDHQAPKYYILEKATGTKKKK